MIDNVEKGWKKLISGYPWFNCDGCYPLPAYSEFMPSPLVGKKPLGEIDHELFHDDDPFGWHITEIEEEYELRPGIGHTGLQIMNNILKLGIGQKENHIQGHAGQNLKNNPYWPPELASQAGSLLHERYITLLSLMLSRTQDDKGRIIWTFFGNSIDDPEIAFWKSFYNSPGKEIPVEKALSFFSGLLIKAYGETISRERSLSDAGFRILNETHSTELPGWTMEYLCNETDDWDKIKYLLTFRPFSTLPARIKELYLSGKLNLLPFPGSLVFWGMQNYLRLKQELSLAGQIPLLNIVARNKGIGGLRVPQSGWLHEPHIDGVKHEMNEELLVNTFHRTHRWERIHRYQDELNLATQKIKVAKVLLSTDPDAIGLYNKPLARNSHLWTHDFKLLLDGPGANHRKIQETEKEILRGGLFGYRFFYPPMRVGQYEIYWHRPLVAYLSHQTENIEIDAEALHGYITGYHLKDNLMSAPVELWPRLLRRDLYLTALHDFNAGNDHFAHQTSKNLLTLFDTWKKHGEKPLARSFAFKLLNVSKHKTLEEWLEELITHSKSNESYQLIRTELDRIIEPAGNNDLPEPITYGETASRRFEENWWNEIKFLAYGDFLYKDNPDIVTDEATLKTVRKHHRDLENVGNHYDTAYMEDIYEKGRGGTGARLAANGADDNYSASATILQAAPIFLKLAKEGKLKRDIWLIHLTGEEFPADCMGARNLCKTLVEKNINLKLGDGSTVDLSDTKIKGIYIMDMIGHNRENDHDIFQISPGKSAASGKLALQAHIANMIWNNHTHWWNQAPERQHLGRGKRISGSQEIPEPAKHLAICGEVRTQFNPHSSIFNTDGQIFSDVGLPVVLFMENYDIFRTGYHDSMDTMENIDLDYGAAFAAIAIESVARMATLANV
jgi:hypothetical protein